MPLQKTSLIKIYMQLYHLRLILNSVRKTDIKINEKIHLKKSHLYYTKAKRKN